MNNSELRDKLVFFKRKVEAIRALKEEVQQFEESADIPPGSYRVGNDLFVVTYKKGLMMVQIQTQPVDLG